MKLVLKATENYLETFHKAGIKIIILGSREGLSKDVLKALERTESRTKDNQRGTLGLCFNYGGRQEIVDAVRQITDPSKITEESLGAALYGPEMPDIDLLIRTSGEQRTSGFMLWRAAYAELYFTEKFWPEFSAADLDVALGWYADRERRFGS